MKREAFLLFGLTLGSFCSAVQEFVPVQQKAQGQSLSGSSLLNDSIYGNPASSTFTNIYAFEGTFALPRSFSASLLDTRTNDVAGGLAYFRLNPEDKTLSPFHGVRLAMGSRIGEIIGVGVTGKVVWGPDARRINRRFTDADGGVLANLTPIQLGLLVRNIFGGENSLNQVREWSFGARASIQDVLFLSASTYSSFTKLKPYQVGVGAEYVSPWYFGLKGGYRIQIDNPKRNWSLGASFTSPKLSLHYAVELPSFSNESVEHMISTTLLF